MRRRWRAIIGLSVVGIISAIAIILLSTRLLHKSHPKLDGHLTMPDLRSVVKIVRDSNGVPHISANNDDDLFFTLGFVTAQDRLWQMDMLRRTANGTLSEILGDTFRQSDRLFRTIGLNRLAFLLHAGLSDESRRMLQNYVNGINAYLKECDDAFPIEYALMNAHPTRWTVHDCLMIQRLYAWQAAVGISHDLFNAAILQKAGLAKTASLLAVRPSANAVLLPIDVALALHRALHNCVLPFPLTNLSGSAWLFPGVRTKSGAPILAGELTGTYTLPTPFYEVRMNSPFMDVYGWILPGFPGVLVGTNNAITWASIPARVDQLDFFVERMRQSPQAVLLNGKWQPVSEITDLIHIKNQPADTLKIRLTDHGPVISDMIDTLSDKTIVSIRWSGYEQSDDMLGYLSLMKATNLRQAKSALNVIHSPAHYVSCADSGGTLSVFMQGAAQGQKDKTGFFPRAGWKKTVDWPRPDEVIPLMVPADSSLFIVDGQLIAPGAETTPSFAELPARRLTQIATKADTITPSVIRMFLADCLSPLAEQIISNLKTVLPEISISSDNDLQHYFLDALMVWNRQMNETGIAPTIHATLTQHLLRNIFHDEFGDTLFIQFAQQPELAAFCLNRVLKNGDPAWLDDITTPARETMKQILLQSLNGTFAELTRQHGTLIDGWRWGRLHTVTFRHFLARTENEKRRMNIGPFSLSGGNATLFRQSFIYQHRYEAIGGPVVRWIFDMGHPDSTVAIVNTGQCGQPLAPYYRDQAERWLKGQFRRISRYMDQLSNAHQQELILKPE